MASNDRRQKEKRKLLCFPVVRARIVIPLFGILAVFMLFLNILLIQEPSSKKVWTQDVQNWMQTLFSKTRRELLFMNKTDNVHVHGNQIRNLNNCTEQFKNNHLMTISYSGRTGNLLFQLASLLAIANVTCFTPVCKPEHLRFLDPIFDIKNVIRMSYNQETFRALREPGYATYHENVTTQVSPDSNWIIGGYRQSFRYFENHVDLVKSSFRFKESVKKDVLEYINDKMFRNKIKVCLHVRRGDIAAARRTAELSDVDFFNRAINYTRKHLSPLTFELIVVSDGMSWCRHSIKGGYVHYSPFRDAGRDLYLLTQCDHNIISCGTFSWMGAWLNETGVVIYDKKLTRLRNGFKHEDHYFSHWIAL